ncbi:coiled-coil domain-containing protein 180 isoform X2 [Rhinatrema bivittatum]|uniref:coiled-coil domain-containing protein 180 isoform X2 n=1 Tax=Rhinatrema bivittatum TaxID=194408 RepID=UPI00112AC6C1|nr:coiled-coil domain-containing protein 180 isoform X2 [Rhinatrema bivittatum]
MAMVGESHVVPSGKVYRQIFDAEVQLVRSLREARARAAQHVFPLESVRIPLVRDVETRAGTLLSPRQQLWTESMPNDGVTENPVFYREFMTAVNQKTQESEAEIAAREVRGLADVIVPETADTGFLQRLTENRRECHEAALAALQQKLVHISKDMEALVLTNGKSFQSKLTISDRNIERLFEKIENENDRIHFKFQDFKEVWVSITQDSLCRRQWIKDLDKTLTNLEGDRAKQIGDVLKEYTKTLEKISYLMPHDVCRLIHKEAMMINQAMLANLRAIAKLSMNLVEAVLKRETSQWLRWQDIVKSWKSLQKELVIQKFREYIDREEVQNPESVKEVLNLMVKLQGELNEQRLQHLHSVRELLPPISTKSQVDEWYTILVDLNKEIDNFGVQCLSNIRIQCETICQQCVSEIQQRRTQLVDLKVCYLEEAQKFVIANLFPLVGRLQKKFEEELELIDKALVKLTRHINVSCKDLFKYSEAAVNLWDVLESGLLQQEKLLQRKLKECREQHDAENQVKEANLDMILDKLRQESFQQELDNTTQKALDALEDIRTGYEMLHRNQVEIVATYPRSILTEITSYTSSISQYFGVKEIFGQELFQVDAEITQDDVPVESFTTSNGNTYTIFPSKELAPPITEEVFITEVTVAEELPVYLQQIFIPENTFTELKEGIRLGFFEHLEMWFDQAISESQSIVASKTDELTSELELSCHLQEPRAQRIEKDVRHVRAAELLLHQERVDSHCEGVKEALKKLKLEFILLKDNMKNETKNFRQTISNMEHIFLSATKSDKLVALSSSLRSRQDSHMERVRVALRNYRQHLEETLGILRDSNADFVKSFRLFSAGGNFSPEEFGMLRNRLLKASKDIDAAERFIMTDLEGMESKCLEQATEIISKFEEKFQTLTTDMIFMENIQRHLTHLQVKIKAEVAISNLQAQKVHDSLECFMKKIDACTQSNMDKEAVTSEELYNYAESVMDDMVNRSKYLNCLLDSTPDLTEPPLQGSIAAAAARSETFRQETKVTFLNHESLLQPSQMGRLVVEDAAVSLIKSILESQHPHKEPEQERIDSRQVIGIEFLQMATALSPHSPGQATDGTYSSITTATKKLGPAQNQELSIPLISFRHFKGKIAHILWESNNMLLALAEEFYSRKEKRFVARLECLQETYDQCANVFMLKLQSYQNQADEYYNACLQEFQEQLEQLRIVGFRASTAHQQLAESSIWTYCTAP